MVRAVPPIEQYPSTSRNGIRSRSWGRVLTGVSYKVQSCVAITVNNQTIELSGDPERVKPSVPTFFPNVVESVVNTRASAASHSDKWPARRAFLRARRSARPAA